MRAERHTTLHVQCSCCSASTAGCFDTNLPVMTAAQVCCLPCMCGALLLAAMLGACSSWVVLLSAFVPTASSVQLGVCGRPSRLRCQMLLSELPFAFGEACAWGIVCVWSGRGDGLWGVSQQCVGWGWQQDLCSRWGSCSLLKRVACPTHLVCVCVRVFHGCRAGWHGALRCVVVLCCATGPGVMFGFPPCGARPTG